MSTFQLNTGSYWGNGTTSVGSTGRYGSRVASSTQINRISRDITSGYSNDLSIVNKYLEKGETDKAIDLYQDIISDAKTTALNYGYSLTDSQIESILNNAYSGVTGTSMTSAVTENTSSSFMTGFKEGLPLVGLLFNGTSEDEALAEMSGESVSVKDKVKEYGGAIASGAACGAAIGSFVPVLGTGIGAAIGGAVGATQTLLKDLF